MKPGPGAPSGRRAGGHSLGALIASALLALVLIGCGITLGADEDESEIFSELTIEGDFTAGGLLTLTLEYEQPYPVDVAIVCDLLAAEERTQAIATPAEGETDADRVLRILSESLPANPVGGPVGEATPEAGTVQWSFFLPELPGRYRIACFTPADDRNQIGQRITVAARPGPTATALP